MLHLFEGLFSLVLSILQILDNLSLSSDLVGVSFSKSIFVSSSSSVDITEFTSL
jgi:hypothetical protein